MPDDEKETPKQKTHSERAISAIFLCVLTGYAVLFVYSLQAGSFSRFVAVWGIALMVSGAALLCGGLLGFLFGIPRTSQEDRGEDKPDKNGQPVEKDGKGVPVRNNFYKPNTNLEQISDWLTKIIVGVGLIQIYRFPAALRRYAGFMELGLGGFAGSKIFAIAILFFYVIAGFLIGYLWTRLYFAVALRQADLDAVGNKLEQVTNKLSEIERQAEIDARALATVQRQLNPGYNDTPISQDDLTAVIAPASHNIKSQIYYIVHGIRSENWKDMETKPLMERTIPILRALIASDRENVYHLNHGQLGFALKDQRKPDWQEAEAELSRAIEIRGAWEDEGWLLYEFNRAICNIGLDKNFHAGLRSDKPVRDKIFADIKAAKSSPDLGKMIGKEKLFQKWLELNE